MSTWRMAHLLAISGLLFLPPSVWTQTLVSGSIAGVVKDATGAVLPGVTVEAASPALIEKIRAVVTDDQGQYKIVDLRPGTYTVTFALAGFSTARREGIELTTGFTATVNAELRVGELTETITVSGASPIVDTQNVLSQNVLSRATLDTLPTAKMAQGFAAVTLGVTASALPDVGGTNGEIASALSIHGGRGFDMKYLIDGMNYNYSMSTGGGASRAYFLNHVAAQEIVLATGGMSAESETGGIQINIVPKEGGNTVKGSFEAAYSNKALQGDNLTQSLRDRQLTAIPEARVVYDIGGGIGGPIKRDRLWYFGSIRKMAADRYQPGNYFNQTVHSVFYTPDLSRPAYISFPAQDHSVRLTWQAAQKHKVTASTSYQRNCSCYFGTDTNVAPEAARDTETRPSLTQSTWNYAASNRLLFQAGVSVGINTRDIFATEGSLPTDIPITELTTGLKYGAPLTGNMGITLTDLGITRPHQVNERFSVSYITGSHAFKVGFYNYNGFIRRFHTLNGNPDVPGNPALAYNFSKPTPDAAPVPVSLVQFASPQGERERTFNLGIYAQDQWTLRRLTLNLGARFDQLREWVPRQSRPAGAFTPELHFDKIDDVPNWKDFSPRLGAAYDLFGNGKTAIKGSLGRYLQGDGTNIAAANNPVNTIVVAVTRTWNDTNRNYIPDCNVYNPLLNGECGQVANLNFGTSVVNQRYDSELLRGWGLRQYTWQGSASLDHELRPGVGLRVGYFRTWYGNFTVTQNLDVTPADFDPFCITAPVDTRLPDGGGNRICGLYDIKPSAFGRVNNLVTLASNFGKQIEVYDGMEVAISARFGQGGMLSGGVSTGRLVTDNCDIVTNHPEVTASSTVLGNSGPTTSTDHCHATQPFEADTQIKINGAYPLPWWGLQASATFQNLPGSAANASYSATNAQIRPSLNRDLGQCRGSATCNGTVVIANLYAPNTKFEDRLTQLDVRLTKTVRWGRAKVRGIFDIYNALNGNTVVAVTSRYGSQWLRPNLVLAPRLFKFGVAFDF